MQAHGGHLEGVSSAGRVLGIDFGDVRIGLAVSDSSRLLASPHSVLRRSTSHEVDHRAIAELIDNLRATIAVVGLPLSLDGQMGPAAQKVTAEVEELRKVVLCPVVVFDERLTTVEALRLRHSSRDSADALRRGGRGGRSGPSRKGGRTIRDQRPIDDAAAAVFLQAFLEQERHS